jgi:hypothetical protein
LNTGPLLAESSELNHQFSSANMKRALLEEFRQAAYSLLGRAHDATFELTDARLADAERLQFGRFIAITSI